MKWFRKKKEQVDPGSKDEALLPVVDVVSSGLSRLEQQIQEVMMQNKYVMDLNNKVLEQNTSMLRTISSVDSKDAEEPLAIKQGSFTVKVGVTEWKVSGYSSVAPDADFDYFPELKFEPKRVGGATYDFYPHKVISCIIPCYNESAKELKRSVRSLFRQRMPTGWRVEAVIVMDGADCMEPKLTEYLSTMFGVRFNSNDPETDPFLMLPLAQTIIVEPINEEAAHLRTPVMECTVGGFSLVVKRTNQRKANSQMWWLGPHSSGISCKYSLATDCGTVFSRTATVRLIRRMEAEPDLHAVTGFQRIMTSEMQGDGSWEIIHDPAAYCLRMLQRFEFEVDHVSFKAIYDTLGCMHVIPGPCGLFRYSAMGSLKEGLMKQYFSLFQRSNHGLIVGNVELVEDRIPGTLLSFPLRDSHDLTTMPDEGWPRTGFVHDAVFYVEAEKPLGQFVKQRRRWLNGTFATYIWMMSEGIVTRANQEQTTKLLSWLLVILNVIQGFVVRFFGPALLIVWMFRFGLFIPDIFNDPIAIFDPDISITALEFEEDRFKYGIVTGGMYALFYVFFVVGHIPRAKPSKGTETTIVRYTEPTAYCSDSRSAFRSTLFYSSMWINVFVVSLLVANAAGIVWTLGWDGTPVCVRILICIWFVPFGMGVLDAIVRRDIRTVWGMMISAPAAMPLMVWFSVFLPAYATTRLSDLTWGNRQGKGIDESKSALMRAKHGRTVAWILICFNILVALTVILLMQFYGVTFPIFVMSYTLILSVSFLLSLLDMVYRLCTCQYCFSSTSDDEMINGGDEDDEQAEDEAFACGPTCVDVDDDVYINLNDDDLSKEKKKEGEVTNGGTSDTEESTTTTEEDVATGGGGEKVAIEEPTTAATTAMATKSTDETTATTTAAAAAATAYGTDESPPNSNTEGVVGRVRARRLSKSSASK